MRRRFRRRPPISLLVLLLVLLLVGLRARQKISQQSQTPPPIETQNEGIHRIVNVVDGQTLVVTNSEPSNHLINGPQTSVRLLSVDVPESAPFGPDTDSWRSQAAEFTRSFVAGGQVFLRFDKLRRDRLGCWLAYVYVNDQMLNEELVRHGLATVKIHQGNSTTLARRLRRAEQEARNARRGIWSEVAADAPS